MKIMTALLLYVAAFCLALYSGAGAIAQSYPTKPVRFLVGAPAGGSLDITTRVVGQGLSEATGQPFIIDNRVGAGGNIGMDALLKAPADGYTVFVGGPGIAANPTLYAKVPYKIDDLVAITVMAEAPLLIMAQPSLPASSIPELIKLAKAKPGMFRIAVFAGGSSQFASEMFRMMAGVDMPQVPYKAGAQAFTDVIGGRVEVVVLPISESLPHVKAKNVKALGQTGTKRSSLAPDIPTLDEAGLKGYALTTWYMVVGPEKMPREIVTRLSQEIAKVLKRPETQAKLKTAGVDIVGSTPEQTASFLRSEHEKLSKLIRLSGARVE